MKTVPLDLLNELADCIPKMPAGKADRGPSATFDLDRWIQDRGIDVKGPLPWNGGRKWVFNECPWNTDHRNKSAYIIQLSNGAIVAGCLHRSCNGNNWAALRDLLEPGWRSHRRAEAAYDLGEDSAWEPPIPFHQLNLPLFPTDAFPAWLRKFVEAIASATQTPVDLVSMLALSVIATACAKKVEVCIKEDYFEPVNIFTATALPSGTRKSSVFAAVTKPLEDYERSEARRTGRENAMRLSRRKIKETAHQKLQDKAAGATGKEQLEFIKEAEALAAELADAGLPLPTRIIADDCTPESLATLLCDNGGRIAVMSAEGDVFELLAGRYSANKTPNFAVYLKGHAGDQLHVDRRNREEFVGRPALTVGLAVQPHVIRGLAEKHGFRERGLLGRFLYSMPQSLLGRRDTNPPPVPAEVRDTYRTNVLVLLNLTLPQNDLGDADPHVLVLDPEARLQMQRFENWIEPQLSEFGALGGMSDWSGKLYGATGRIAGILHMADVVASAAPWDIPISASTVRCAIRIAKYLIPHTKAA